MVLILAACEHTKPFSVAGPNAAGGPFAPGSPARLTYNFGVDAWPAWLPDGAAFIYTQEQLASTDRDQCLAVMPGVGGTVTRTICPGSDPHGDTLNVYQSASVSRDGQLAYVRLSTLANVGRHTPDYAQLVVAPYAQPLATTVLEPLSYFGPSNRSVDLVRDIRWIGPRTLIYVAEQVTYTCANFGCTTFDTTNAGLEVQQLDYSSASPALSVVPGTDAATSLAVGRTDTIYFTIAGSGAVHRRILSAGADTVLFDFGSPATDLSVAGTRMAAVIGSALRVVDPATSLDVTLGAAWVNIHHPALSPDGKRLVAEMAPVDSVTLRERTPTDLWMWTLP